MNEADKAKAIRFGYLTQSPGWPDLVQLLNRLVQEAVDQANSFAGWDRDQKCDLMARQQAVAGMRDELLKRIQNFLLAANSPEDNNTEQVANLADAMRRPTIDESRIPGTYEV